MILVFKEFDELNLKEHKELLTIRNSEYVKKNMKNDSIIKMEDHLHWIEELKSDKNNIYYAIFDEKTILGAIYITTIDKVQSTCFWGLYFKKGINPLVSSLSAILIIEKIFKEFNINKLYAEVKKENINAYNFNISIGLTKDKEVDENYFKLSINNENWQNNINNKMIQRIKKRLNKIQYKFINNLGIKDKVKGEKI